MAKLAPTGDSKLDDLRELFQYCADAETEQRERMLADLRFGRLGEQWPTEILESRKKRPSLTINKLPAFMRQVINDARQNRPQIKVKPTETGDITTANIYSALIRQIEAASQADQAYDTAMDFAVSCGIGYIRVDVEYASGLSFAQRLCIKRVSNVFSVFGDPDGKEASSKDWNKAFFVDYLSKDEFKKEYKGTDPIDWDTTGYGSLPPPWLDEDNVMLCESWQREKAPRTILMLSNGTIIGQKEYENAKSLYDAFNITVKADRQEDGYKITQNIMTGMEILDTTSWVGNFIPVIPVYGEEINIQGEKRYNSLIHASKDAQRMFNYWRSAATELVALAPKTPYIGEEGSFDVDGEKKKWDTANTESWPYLQYKRGTVNPPQRQEIGGGQAVGAMSEALAASDDIKSIIGLYDASLGQRSNETSGKAILTRQHEGDVSTFHFIDNLSRSIQHLGVILVDMIPKVYTGDRMIRVLGEDGKSMLAKIGSTDNMSTNNPNQMPPAAPPPQPGLAAPGMGPPPGTPGPGGPPPPQMPAMAPPGPPQGLPLQGEAPATPPGLMPQMMPSGDFQLPGVYDLAAGTYDVVVDTGPSYTTRREELSFQMTEFARAFPAALPIIGDILVKSLDWPQAEEIARRLEAFQKAQGGQMPPQIQSQIQQLTQQVQQLTMENLAYKQRLEIEKAKIVANQATEQHKLSIDEYAARTDRLKVAADTHVAHVGAEQQHLDRIHETKMELPPFNFPQPPAPPMTNGNGGQGV